MFVQLGRSSNLVSAHESHTFVGVWENRIGDEELVDVNVPQGRVEPTIPSDASIVPRSGAVQDRVNDATVGCKYENVGDVVRGCPAIVVRILQFGVTRCLDLPATAIKETKRPLQGTEPTKNHVRINGTDIHIWPLNTCIRQTTQREEQAVCGHLQSLRKS